MMDVDAAFVADGEPSKFVEPGETALDHRFCQTSRQWA
jgi:hypothetical protein